jgi:hypothetical protein
VEAPRSNAWLDMPAVAVFETFAHSVDQEETEAATRRALLAFVQGAGSSERQGGGWKRAYKRFADLCARAHAHARTHTGVRCDG